MDMSDVSMGASEGGGTPMAQSPRSDDVTAASGPNVAALGEALEAPLEFTELKASILSPEARPPKLCTMHAMKLWKSHMLQCSALLRTCVLATCTRKGPSVNSMPQTLCMHAL